MLTRRSFTFPALSIAAAGLAGCGSRSIVALPEIGSAPKGLTTRTLARPNYAEVYTEYPGERFPIMAIDYQRQLGFIRFVGTHAQYDQINAETA